MNNEMIPIILSADDNYAPFVLTTILSVAEHTQSKCHFYVLDSGIDSEKQSIITEHCNILNNCSITFVPVQSEMLFHDFCVDAYYSRAVFNRILIPRLLPDIHKAIYLDVDIIAFGDVERLYAIDLDEFCIAAVPDQACETVLTNLKARVELLPDSIYFNSGVLLMNLDKCRQEDVIPELFQIEQRYRGQYLGDQDILNKYFEKNYEILPTTFNWQINGSTDCILRHYLALPKPWEMIPSFCTDDFADYMVFWDYLKKTPFYEDTVSKCKIKTPQQLQFHRFFRKRILFK